jgi:thiol-disulfide isomerase/thioredoxin
MKRNILIIAPIALLFGIIGVYFGWKHSEPAAAANGAVSALLSQSLPDVQGKSQPLSQWKGRPMVVNFWATWCAPCVQEMPELSALQSELTSHHIQIVGIGIDSPSNIAEFSRKYNIAYPLYIAGMSGTDLSRLFGNQGGSLPFTVLIGADGQVRKTYLGRLKFDELRRDLASLY